MALDPLITTTDLEDRLGRALTTDETAKVDAIIADVSASMRSYARQQLSAGTSTDVRLRVRRGKIRLPQRPVTAVTQVTDINGNLLRFQWQGDEWVLVQTNLDSFDAEPWRNGITFADVTYEHGYAELPDDLVGVGCSIALRALGRDPAASGLTSESIAGYSYTLGSAAAAGGFGMLDAEREILFGYRPQGGFVQAGP